MAFCSECGARKDSAACVNCNVESYASSAPNRDEAHVVPVKSRLTTGAAFRVGWDSIAPALRILLNDKKALWSIGVAGLIFGVLSFFDMGEIVSGLYLALSLIGVEAVACKLSPGLRRNEPPRKKLYFHYVYTSIVVGLWAGLATLLLIVPGVFVYGRLAPALVLRDLKGFKAASRSWKLTKGYGFKTAAALFFPIMVPLVAYGILQILLSSTVSFAKLNNHVLALNSLFDISTSVLGGAAVWYTLHTWFPRILARLEENDLLWNGFALAPECRLAQPVGAQATFIDPVLPASASVARSSDPRPEQMAPAAVVPVSTEALIVEPAAATVADERFTLPAAPFVVPPGFPAVSEAATSQAVAVAAPLPTVQSETLLVGTSVSLLDFASGSEAPGIMMLTLDRVQFIPNGDGAQQEWLYPTITAGAVKTIGKVQSLTIQTAEGSATFALAAADEMLSLLNQAMSKTFDASDPATTELVDAAVAGLETYSVESVVGASASRAIFKLLQMATKGA